MFFEEKLGQLVVAQLGKSGDRVERIIGPEWAC